MNGEMMSENSILRKIFGTKRAEITVGGRSYTLRSFVKYYDMYIHY
jgi:hypothetical protein